MFSMPIDDVFVIQRRGLVATGRIASGTLRVGDQVWVNGRAVTVDGIETFRKAQEQAAAGATVGLLFRSLSKNDVHPGDVISSSSLGDQDPGEATFTL